MQDLSPDKCRRADALHASYNDYQCLQNKSAEHNVWLAADDEQGAHHAMYERLHKAFKEYVKLCGTRQ